jgi:hypothetical protein
MKTLISHHLKVLKFRLQCSFGFFPRSKHSCYFIRHSLPFFASSLGEEDCAGDKNETAVLAGTPSASSVFCEVDEDDISDEDYQDCHYEEIDECFLLDSNRRMPHYHQSTIQLELTLPSCPSQEHFCSSMPRSKSCQNFGTGSTSSNKHNKEMEKTSINAHIGSLTRKLQSLKVFMETAAAAEDARRGCELLQQKASDVLAAATRLAQVFEKVRN